MAMTDDNIFTLTGTDGKERFRLAMSSETLFIQTKNGSQSSTFMADRTEAIELRDWLNQNLEP